MVRTPTILSRGNFQSRRYGTFFLKHFAGPPQSFKKSVCSTHHPKLARRSSTFLFEPCVLKRGFCLQTLQFGPIPTFDPPTVRPLIDLPLTYAEAHMRMTKGVLPKDSSWCLICGAALNLAHRGECTAVQRAKRARLNETDFFLSTARSQLRRRSGNSVSHRTVPAAAPSATWSHLLPGALS